MVAVSLGSYFGGGVETEEQLDAALAGVREECTRLIGAGKLPVVSPPIIGPALSALMSPAIRGWSRDTVRALTSLRARAASLRESPPRHAR